MKNSNNLTTFNEKQIMKSKRTFIDYPNFIREPLTEKEKGLVESAMQQVSELRKRYNVKIDLLESPHKENNFEDELSEEDLKVVVKELKMQTL